MRKKGLDIYKQDIKGAGGRKMRYDLDLNAYKDRKLVAQPKSGGKAIHYSTLIRQGEKKRVDIDAERLMCKTRKVFLG